VKLQLCYYTLRGVVIAISKSLIGEKIFIAENTVYARDLLVKRLSRIEGQIRGIKKMVSEDRDCVSLISQIAAVRSGIEGAGAIVLNNCMKTCLTDGPNEQTNLDTLSRAIAIWGHVRTGDNA
jgi:DNA-binding FrmR family transcriptional regulator